MKVNCGFFHVILHAGCPCVYFCLGTLLKETMKGYRGHFFMVKTLDQRSGAYFEVPLDKLRKDAQANDLNIIPKW